jgi:hypothetical protein
MSINDIGQKIKGWLTSDIGQTVSIIAIIIVVGIGSFLLGRMSKSTPDTQVIEDIPDTIPKNSANSVLSEENSTSTKIAQNSQNGAFIASKNGTKYYPNGCSGINKIKVENRINFTTEQEALASGRTKSSTCK